MKSPAIADDYLHAARAAMVEIFGGDFVVRGRQVERPRGRPGADHGPTLRVRDEVPATLALGLAMPFSPAEPTWVQQLADDVERVRYTRTMAFDQGPDFALRARWLELGPLRRLLAQVPGRTALLEATWDGWRLQARFKFLPAMPPFEVWRTAVALRAGLVAALPADLRQRVERPGGRVDAVQIEDSARAWLDDRLGPYNGIVERTVRGVEGRVHLGGLVDEAFTGEVRLTPQTVSLRALLPPTAGRLQLLPQRGWRARWLSLFENTLGDPALDEAFVVTRHGDDKPRWAGRVRPLLLRLAALGAQIDWDEDVLHVAFGDVAGAARGDAVDGGLALWAGLCASLCGLGGEDPV